jgi:dTDP-4-dehydrorhamnose reductase
VTLRVAIVGSGGRLGRQVESISRAAGHETLALTKPEFDLLNPAHLAEIAEWRPDVVINAAAWTDVDGCARDPERAMLINGSAAGALAAIAAGIGSLSVQISTNEVFDGEANEPYLEGAPLNPINPYGLSKAAGEEAVAAANTRHLIVRTAWVFGPGKPDFPTKIRRAAQDAVEANESLPLVGDEFGNPTWAEALAKAILTAVEHTVDHGGPRVLHLAGQPAASRREWAMEVIRSMPTQPRIQPVSREDWSRASRTPARAVLATELSESIGIAPLDWREPLSRYLASLPGIGA